MGLKYTQVKDTAYQELVLNAGILCDDFTPSTGAIGNIIGATSGGINFASNPTYIDFGEDIDNCPPNTWQMKRVSYYDPTISGTFLTVTSKIAAELLGAADVDDDDETKVAQRAQLEEDDFKDLWFIGDYSDVNTGNNAGFLAIKLSSALNTTGFQIQSGKDAKGTMSFEYHGHYDITDEDQTPPFDIYVKAGTAETTTTETTTTTTETTTTTTETTTTTTETTTTTP